MTTEINLRLPSAATPSLRQPIWRPIGSAPTNQKAILIYWPAMPQHEQQFVVSWQSNLGADGNRTTQHEWCEIVTGLPGLDEPDRPSHLAMLRIRSLDLDLAELELLGWLPIELAPRDRSPILVCDPALASHHRVFAARWEDTEAGIRAENLEWCEAVTGLAGINSPFRPTHFTSLPPAPRSIWRDDIPR